MASELKVDKIFNAGGDQDSGINLATNDTIKFDIATSTKATMASTGIVTIVGEGGTTTTNLQQGLAKTWVNYAGSGTSARDSLNLTAMVDNGTGDYSLTIANNMANANYSTTGAGEHHVNNHTVFFTIDRANRPTAAVLRANTMNQGGSFTDIIEFNCTIHGDLA